MLEANQDKQLSKPDGSKVMNLIDGVIIRPAVTIPDDRGTLCEILSFNWGDIEPIVHVYQFTIRPGKIKGWVVHHEQIDRIFVSKGTAKIVLYDDRPESPTYQQVNEIYLSELNRGLLHIPKFVYHAFQNVGTDELLCINLPTKPYNYAKPDKYRLSVDTPLIPYAFQ